MHPKLDNPMRYVSRTRAMDYTNRRVPRTLRFVPWILGALTFTLGAQQIAMVTLAQLRHQFRPVLIFAPRPDDPQMEIQVRTLQEHAAEAQDRDLAVIAIPYGSPSPSRLQLVPEECEAARRRFHVSPEDFAVILLGKDGTEKLRSGKPISMNTLSATIDRMPMRQEETKAKGHL